MSFSLRRDRVSRYWERALTPHPTMTSMITMEGLSPDAARAQMLIEEGTCTSI
jgi:hypothetical protein